MKDLFGDDIVPELPKRTKDGSFRNNPLHKIYGIVDDKRCKNCIFFHRKKFAKTYFKCKKRGLDGYAKTDHRANWKACGLFTEKIEVDD